MRHKSGLQFQLKKLFYKIKKAIFHLFRLTNDPVVKVYHGYGNEEKIVLFGHVLSKSPIPRKKFRSNLWTNAFALLRSFMLVPIPNARVRVHWEGHIFEDKTAHDGFFRIECKCAITVPPGLHQVKVEYYEPGIDMPLIIAEGLGWVVIPHISQLAFISDIDDTFLISYSSSFFRKLYVLLSKNAHSRKPFDGVVRHYNLLAKAQMKDGANSFFYVSSSEWNLYDFIKEFSRKNNLPEGVYLLSTIKRFSQLWNTGGNNHSTKFMRIARIIDSYPKQTFVLLGDDSQMDPEIYASIADHFPTKIKAVYLRNVFDKNYLKVNESIKKLQIAGVEVCHFEHSKTAIEHSQKIGLI